VGAALLLFSACVIENNGERGWIRTSDPRLKRALLYQLSYAPTLSNLTQEESGDLVIG
jgi:hypothetical protein